MASGGQLLLAMGRPSECSELGRRPRENANLCACADANGPDIINTGRAAVH